MRKILFRGKRADNDKWVEGYYFKNATWHKNPHTILDAKMISSHVVDPETVGQFTGLHDKNGKMIFEGDVVDCCRYYYKAISQVIVRDIRTMPSDTRGSHLKWLEVVGNIHDKEADNEK